ncbi:hypothetical protein MRB53_039040 [Persea americana]|nr:hypothetical protein MRB53_039040 [Persea americana]
MESLSAEKVLRRRSMSTHESPAKSRVVSTSKAIHAQAQAPQETVELLSSEAAASEDKSVSHGGRSPAFHHAVARSRGYYERHRRWLRPLKLCCFICFIPLLVILLVLGIGGYWIHKHAPKDGQSPPWYPSPAGGTMQSWSDSYAKAALMVGRMSLLEKVNVTTGIGWSMGMCVGNTGPATNVGFPSLCLQDGPLGVRFADNITATPAGITIGATWNKDLMYMRGRLLGAESRAKGVNALLGPCVGPLGKSPAGGRNWEGFGADPVLQGVAAAETIRGMHEEGVMAVIKHFIGNEQEHFRQAYEWILPNAISENIDDRTLHELYAWPFADAVRAGVASVMCSYNQVNNSYACQNSKLLNGILKDELGFQGFVQSDWLAQRSGVASALAGLDVTMPGDGLIWGNGDSLWGSKLTLAVLNGSMPISRLDDMATRVVAAWYQLGQDTDYPSGPNFSSWTKNETGLVHPASDDNSTAIVNEFVPAKDMGNFSHSALVRRIAAEGIVLLKNDDSILPLSRNGLLIGTSQANQTRTNMTNIGIFGEDAVTASAGPNGCADRGCNTGTLGEGWGSGSVDFPYLVAHSGEGYIAVDGVKGDRNDLLLDKNGDALINAVASGCGGPTVVVIHTVGPVVVESFITNPNVKAVLIAHLPGEESGHALADVLFGDVNPSGHLPYTMGKSLSDYGPGAQILYYPNAVVPQRTFTEGLNIDYREFDSNKTEPRFPFGFGLSYTTFDIQNLQVALLDPSPSRLPAPRPSSYSSPPRYDSTTPDPQDVVFPRGWRQLKKYIYPYIDSASDVKTGPAYKPASAPAAPLSQAGGGEGGNPDLYSVLATVQVTVANTGSRDGQGVPQLYINFPNDTYDEYVLNEDYTKTHTKRWLDPTSQVQKREVKMRKDVITFPPRVLRGFDKVLLNSTGPAQNVTFNLTRRDLSFWSVGQQNWVMPNGTFGIEVGFSSRDARVTGSLSWTV